MRASQRSRFSIGRASCAILGACAMAGCGGGVTSAIDGNGQARQADTTVTPLWTTAYAPPGGATLIPHDAEVDDSGNTLVLATFQGPGGPEDADVVVFDPNGKLLQQITVYETASFAMPKHLRVNATGFVTGGTLAPPQQAGPGRGPARVDRFDASYQPVFTYAPVGDTDVGAVDLCPDGSTVAAIAQSGDAALTDLDATGNVQWTTTLASTQVTKIRCLGDGAILVAGISGGVAVAARFDSAGSQSWSWTGADTVSLPLTFDVDGNGNPTIGAATAGQIVVYALGARRGRLTSSWYSGGSGETFSGIAVSDVADVTGGETASESGGSALWTSPTSGAAIAIDGADDAFVCGPTAALIDPNGSTQWSYATGFEATVRADVTSGVARCVGALGGGQVGIVAFQVP